MSDHEMVFKFLKDYMRIEGELKLLQEDKKGLFESMQDKVDVKALKAAIQIAKIRARLGDSESELDNIFDTVSKNIFFTK